MNRYACCYVYRYFEKTHHADLFFKGNFILIILASSIGNRTKCRTNAGNGIEGSRFILVILTVTKY